MRANRNIRLLEIQAAFSAMSFCIPVIVPLYRDEMGLTFADFLLGEAFFAATVVLLDVPSGWISDQWRRKSVLALGGAFGALGYGLLLFADGLAMAIAAQMIIGVCVCLWSGTDTAMLYESLMAEDRTGEYRRREGRRAGFRLYSIALAGTVGGFLYRIDHHLPVLLTVVAQGGSGIAALLMDEPERHRHRPEKHPVADAVETARYALSHPDVGFILIFAGVMFCSTKLVMWAQQPYYGAMGLKESWYGALMAAGFFLGGLSSQLAHRLDGRIGTLKALFASWVAAVAVCLGAAAHVGWTGVALLVVGGSCLYGITNPRVSEAINASVDTARRATVLSTQSLLVSLLFIPSSQLMGAMTERWDVRAGLLSVAGCLLLAGVSLGVWARRRTQP